MEDQRYLDSKSLTNSINKLKIHEPFMLNMFFKAKEVHAADKIDIEIRSNTDNLAKFTSPLSEEAKLVSDRRDRKIQTVTVPRTFEKKVFSAYELQKFKTLGTAYVGSPQDRAAASAGLVSDELVDLKERIFRRHEQMACAGIINGKISYNHDGYNFEVDYGYKPGEQLITLPTAEKWSAATPKIRKCIDNFQLQLMRRVGAQAKNMIVGSEVADKLKSDDDIRKQLDNSYYKAGNINATTQYGVSGRWIGELFGLQIYEYVQQYTEDGVAIDLFPANNVLLVAEVSGAFKKHYGPAYRINESGLQVLTNDITVQSRVNDERTVLTWSVEQKMLPTIHVPEAIISATVL